MPTEKDQKGATQAEQDRRGAPRYPAHFNVEATIGFAAPMKLLVVSVSQTGIFFKTDAPPAIGDRIAVFVNLPYATVRLTSTVKRVVDAPAPGEERGFAVQIDRIDEGEQAWSGLVRTARMRAPKPGGGEPSPAAG